MNALTKFCSRPAEVRDQKKIPFSSSFPHSDCVTAIDGCQPLSVPMHLTESERLGQVNTAHQTWRQVTAPTGYGNDGGQRSRGRLRAQSEQKPKSAFWLKPLSCCVLSTDRTLVRFPGVNLDENGALLYIHTLAILLLILYLTFPSILAWTLSTAVISAVALESFYWKGVSYFICM